MNEDTTNRISADKQNDSLQELHSLQEALRKSEQRYRGLFEESPVAILETDYTELLDYISNLKSKGIHNVAHFIRQNPEAARECILKTHILNVNRSTLTLFKANDNEEFIARFPELLTPTLMIKLTTVLCGILEGKPFFNTDISGSNFAGETIYVLAQWSMLPGVADNSRRILISLINMTDYKRAEEQAKFHQQQLVQADKLASLGTLVAGVAHEINNPNSFIMLNAPTLKNILETVIPSYLELCKEHSITQVGRFKTDHIEARISQLISGILEGAQRIKSIVSDLKDYSKQSTAELDQQVNLNEVVQSAITLLTNRIKHATKHFVVETKADIPLVQGNFQRLEQVVINLLTNACDALASPDKELKITTGCDEERMIVTVRVFDQGTGMSEDIMKHIRDPFFTTKRDSGGTGLGLGISTSIIQEHGGALSFDSKPEEGTVATIVLPAVIQQISHF